MNNRSFSVLFSRFFYILLIVILAVTTQAKIFHISNEIDARFNNIIQRSTSATN